MCYCKVPPIQAVIEAPLRINRRVAIIELIAQAWSRAGVWRTCIIERSGRGQGPRKMEERGGGIEEEGLKSSVWCVNLENRLSVIFFSLSPPLFFRFLSLPQELGLSIYHFPVFSMVHRCGALGRRRKPTITRTVHACSCKSPKNENVTSTTISSRKARAKPQLDSWTRCPFINSFLSFIHSSPLPPPLSATSPLPPPSLRLLFPFTLRPNSLSPRSSSVL